MQVDNVQHIGEVLFVTSFIGDVISFVLITVAILVMHFLMPKAVLDEYFKPPYFRELECKLFTGIPYAPMRTIMFMRAIAFPNSGKKRGITEAHMLVPGWYRMVSKILVILIVVLFIIIVVQVIGFWILLSFNGTPV